MQIDVLLFGPAALAVGTDRLRLTLPTESTCADAMRELAAARPTLGPIVQTGRLAVNHEFAATDCRIQPGDEVALVSMVSGG